jgi:hypothetical protein
VYRWKNESLSDYQTRLQRHCPPRLCLLFYSFKKHRVADQRQTDAESGPGNRQCRLYATISGGWRWTGLLSDAPFG